MELMQLRLITVDTFTQCRFGGNPVAVVLDSEEIPPMYFPQIANEIGLTQTVFVEDLGDENYFLRFFTPTKQIEFSAHATLAAFYVLIKDGYIRPIENGRKIVSAFFESDIKTEIYIDYNNYDASLVKIVMPQIFSDCITRSKLDAEGLSDVLNIDVNDILHFDVSGVFKKDILVTVKTKDILDNLKPDFWKLSGLSELLGINGFFINYFNVDKKYAYARYFAPSIGIYEEAVTGSAAACLGKFILDKYDLDSITIYQGQIMNRPGKIEIIKEEKNYIVGGNARVVTDGIMQL